MLRAPVTGRGLSIRPVTRNGSPAPVRRALSRAGMGAFRSCRNCAVNASALVNGNKHIGRLGAGVMTHAARWPRGHDGRGPEPCRETRIVAQPGRPTGAAGGFQSCAIDRLRHSPRPAPVSASASTLWTVTAARSRTPKQNRCFALITLRSFQSVESPSHRFSKAWKTHSATQACRRLRG